MNYTYHKPNDTTLIQKYRIQNKNTVEQHYGPYIFSLKSIQIIYEYNKTKQNKNSIRLDVAFTYNIIPEFLYN